MKNSSGIWLIAVCVKSTSFKLEQSENTPEPTADNLPSFLDKLTLINPVQPLNASFPIDLTFDKSKLTPVLAFGTENSRVVDELEFVLNVDVALVKALLNALAPIFSTFSRLIFDKFAQFWKAESSILVAVGGNVTLLKPVHPLNALLPISCKPNGAWVVIDCKLLIFSNAPRYVFVFNPST